MRRVLAAAVLMAFLPTANAQDKGKADLSTNAEYRARFFYFQNPGFSETGLSSATSAEGRFKLGLNYKANEKISAHVTLLHNTNFGIDNNTDPAAQTGANAPAVSTPTTEGDNLISVNEAYATWMSSDDLNFKVGRMNWTVGDGSIVSANDWEKVPYSFEGLLGSWEQEWGKLQLALFKVRNPTGTSASAVPQHNMYGLNFDLKTMPEWLKAVNAHIFKDNADAIEGAGGGTTVMGPTTNGLDTMRYGFMASFGFNAFDIKANWEKQSGKMKNIAVGGAKTELDYEGDMMQVEAGYTLASFMGSRFFVLYHKDSGDETGADSKLGTYDSYYTDAHGGAGYMDLLGWGNLTDIAVGWTMKPADKTDVGITYHMFSRTEASATSATYTRGTYGATFLPAGAANDKDDLGTEIDLWATHHYDGGLSTTAFIGYFTPGDYFKDPTNGSLDDKAMFVMLEGKATF